MIGSRPKFMDSPYFVDDLFNWHLKPGAPADVVKEFNDYMNQDKLADEKPVKKSFTEQVKDLLSGK